MRARTRIYLSIYVNKNLHRKTLKALTSCQGFIFTKHKPEQGYALRICARHLS